MVTVEQIRRDLQDRVLMRVAEGSGVSWHAVRKIARGEVTNPEYETVVKLVNYLYGSKSDEPKSTNT